MLDFITGFISKLIVVATINADILIMSLISNQNLLDKYSIYISKEIQNSSELTNQRGKPTYYIVDFDNFVFILTILDL